MKDLIIDVNAISDRMIIIKLKVDPVRTINLVQCYAPQTGCDDLQKAEFEELLEDKVQCSNTIVIGDLNAQVGSNRQGYEDILGAHGWGPRNKAGESPLDLCIRNSLIIGNSWFKKQKTHKITRYGWDGQRESIIDYFLVDKELHNTLLNVKVIPSVSLGSDHRLIVGNFKFKHLRELKTVQEQKIKVWKLREPENSRRFEQIIRKKIPRTEMSTVEEEWKNYKNSIIQAAEEVCGRTKGVRRWKETVWWNSRTKEAVLQKNTLF